MASTDRIVVHPSSRGDGGGPPGEPGRGFPLAPRCWGGAGGAFRALRSSVRALLGASRRGGPKLTTMSDGRRLEAYRVMAPWTPRALENQNVERRHMACRI